MRYRGVFFILFALCYPERGLESRGSGLPLPGGRGTRWGGRTGPEEAEEDGGRAVRLRHLPEDLPEEQLAPAAQI